RAVGGGRYSTDSRVEIDASADVCGYVEKGACAVEESEIYGTAPMICAYYEYKEKKDEFDGKQEVVISRGSYSETVALPENYSGFFRILEQTGTYSLKTGTGGVIKNITYSSNKNSSSKKTSEKFEISSGINHFILNPSDNCYLEELTLNTGDIILTESQTSKSVSLSASTKKVTNGTCSVHKGTSIKYSYEIINDPYNIVELDGKKLTANIKVSGTYPVTIRVRAECGTLETEKDFVINAVKQTAVHDLSKEDLYIKSNGVYTTKNSSTRYNITVAPDLDDVNIIFTNGFTLDMSKDTTLRKSPIVIGDNSKVTITRTSSVILKSTDDGSCISGGKNSVITVKGNGTFTLDSYDKGNCITGGTVYLLDGKYNMSAEDGALIKANNLFIADNVDDLSGHTENNKSYPLDAKYMTEKYETYEPAYVIQGKLSNSFTGDNSSITVQKTSGTSKTSSSETVSGLNKDTKSFAVKVATYGNYKASFKDGGGVSKDYSVKDGSRSVTEITLAEEREYIASNEYVFNECKCKLSAPVFSMDKIILPYDKKSASYALDADGAILKVDDDCKIHNKHASVSYRYTIDTDKDEIASISDGRIRFNVDDPGKYSVKVTATARMDSIESSKSITISVTRLSQEETSKQRGELHKAYLNGYSDDTFKPDNNITRAEAAAMLTSALDYEIDDDADVGFFDVSRKSWYYDVVLSVEQAKVFSGYEDGSFRPDNNITRAEFTVAICNAFAIASNSKSTSKSKMSDMNEHWSKGYVDALVKAKYINGYEDGTFRPDNYITRAEAVAILNRAIGRTANETKMKELFVNNPFDDVKKNHWAYFEIMEAVNDHYTNEWHKK
ncbi:MAG: S-layer homology domain-containing protein, partial [Oscillospiraceae bacterium]|nr:S-layer homology domain-containing protein [Oscillospiraceae bacterium]